jgi:16S rRNA (guanine527-N7)-methyltransferase
MPEDLRARVEERAALAGIAVSTVLPRLLAYYELLLRWNRTINLTSLSNPDDAIDRLLLEPVAAAAHLPRHARLADLGSGGGSPAIPLALALEAPSLLMIESRTRKAAFLREALRTVAVPGIVYGTRFEDLGSEADGTADIVSIRAVRLDEAVLEVAARIAPNGPIAAFVGRPDPVLPDGFDLSAAHRLIGNSWLALIQKCST